MKQLRRSLFASLPALLAYALALPWLALRLDRRFALVWPFAPWTTPLAIVITPRWMGIRVCFMH